MVTPPLIFQISDLQLTIGRSREWPMTPGSVRCTLLHITLASSLEEDRGSSICQCLRSGRTMHKMKVKSKIKSISSIRSWWSWIFRDGMCSGNNKVRSWRRRNLARLCCRTSSNARPKQRQRSPARERRGWIGSESRSRASILFIKHTISNSNVAMKVIQDIFNLSKEEICWKRYTSNAVIAHYRESTSLPTVWDFSGALKLGVCTAFVFSALCHAKVLQFLLSSSSCLFAKI